MLLAYVVGDYLRQILDLGPWSPTLYATATVIVRDLDLDMIDEVRKVWAFYRDRRPDAYDSLVAP